MRIKKSDVPAESLARQYMPCDHSDAFVCEVDYAGKISADDVVVNLWTNLPRWVNSLFDLRNFLVRFVGLKGSDNRDLAALEHCIRSGGKHGLASIPAKNTDETVLLLSDTHLDAYLSVRIEKGSTSTQLISLSTVVHFKNKLGRTYFFVIAPFHNIVVKAMLKRSLQSLL